MGGHYIILKNHLALKLQENEKKKKKKKKNIFFGNAYATPDNNLGSKKKKMVKGPTMQNRRLLRPNCEKLFKSKARLYILLILRRAQYFAQV